MLVEWRIKRKLEEKTANCQFLLKFAQERLLKNFDSFKIWERLQEILEFWHYLDYRIDSKKEVSFYLKFLRKKLQPVVKICRFIATYKKGNICFTFSECFCPEVFTLNFKEKRNFSFDYLGGAPFFDILNEDLMDKKIDSNHFYCLLNLTANNKEKTYIEKIPLIGLDLYCVWRFLYFILPGLSPDRFAFCEICQRVMYKFKKGDKYCSRACSQKAYRMRKKQEISNKTPF